MERYQFKSFDHLLRAMDRWFAISKSKRCDAIVKQHDLECAADIWPRDSRGKATGEYTFVGEYDGVMVSFCYWGIIMIGQWQFTQREGQTSKEYAKDVWEALAHPDPTDEEVPDEA